MTRLKPCQKAKTLPLNFNPVKIFVLFFSIGALGSCHPKTPQVIIGQRSSVDWLRSLQEGRPNLRTVRAEARIETRIKARRIRFHASILVSDAGKMYVEAQGFGFSAAHAVLDSKQALIYIPNKGVAYKGDGGDGLVALFGIKMNFRDWINLLLGSVPAYPTTIVHFESFQKETKLTLGRHPNLTLLKFDTTSGWVKEYLRKSDSLIHRILFGKPIQTAYGLYPSQLKIEMSEYSLEIHFRKVEPNPKLDHHLFKLDLPANTTIHPIEVTDSLITP